MHERIKLAEARYFLGRMFSEHDNPVTFAFEASAFLSAARSVLQYALEEARSKSGGQAWYDHRVSIDSLIGFFKDKRDANIHTTPSKPATTLVNRKAALLVTDDDMVIPFPHNTSEYRYRFVDWGPDETVIELSTRYVNALESLVEDGIARQLISG